MTKSRLVVFALLLGSLVACASSPSADGSQVPRRQSNQITQEELDRVQFSNAYELVQTLRPSWLVNRGPMSINIPTAGQVMVYVDGVRLGGPDTLRQISAANVAGAQFLGPNEAAARYGLDHAGGAILIATRRG